MPIKRPSLQSTNSFIPLRRGLQQLLDGLDMARRECLGAVFPAIECAAHLLGEWFGKSEGENHAVIGLAVQEGMQVALQRHAKFPDGELLLAVAVFHDPQFENAKL